MPSTEIQFLKKYLFFRFIRPDEGFYIYIKRGKREGYSKAGIYEHNESIFIGKYILTMEYVYST